jgi:hypothetical protein
MQTRNKRFYSIQVKNNIDKIIENGMEINRKNILDAEEIEYKRVPTEVFSYDAYGFLDKYKEPDETKKYILLYNHIFFLLNIAKKF